MGARKKKGCRYNIFILNGIIHEVLRSSKNKPVLLQVYDYSQMFDSINLKEAISDMYDVGVKDDNLSLLYEANSEIFMAVKTQNGLTDRQLLTDIVLQGDTFGSLLASVQVDAIGKDCVEAGLGYSYKNKLTTGFLGLVDDIVTVTEAGFKAQEMNAFINVKTAEKGLQFGIKKCKSLLVGKNTENVINNKLMVDSWESKYETDGDKFNLVENHIGLEEIGQTDEQTYLGFVISNKGNNMANIKQVKGKSIGIIRKIIHRLESSNLKKYYFESATILLNTMLRPSILYACEAYYDLKETEIRQLERIEESFMRQILKTGAKCPLSQLYLELGQAPARFHIQRTRLLFLHDILQQSESSLIRNFFNLQTEQPSKGDWASSCRKDLTELEICLSFEEVKNLSKQKFSKILNDKIKTAALSYLTRKQNIKGGDISYSKLEISEYLSPFASNLSITDKRNIFAIRNMMTDIPANFSKLSQNMKCICGSLETMEHLYYCEILGSDKTETEYKKIYNGNIHEQIKVFRIFENKLETRNKLKDSSPCDPACDLLISVGNSFG